MWRAFSTLFEEAGWVMVPLFGLCVLAFYTGLTRISALFLLRKARARFLAAAASEVPAAALQTGLPSFDLLAGGVLAAPSLRLRRRAFGTLMVSITPDTRRGLRILSATVVAAPLLGLLGTISGMNEMFSVISLFGFGSPTIMSRGISMALQATLAGLGVALAALFLHNYLGNLGTGLLDAFRQDYRKICGAALGPDSPAQAKAEHMQEDYRLIPEDNVRPEINLAPFVDTIMILLIFFVVTANLYIETGIDVSKPRAAAAKPVSNKSILIGVTREGTVHVFGRQVSLDRLKLIVEQEASRQAGLSVVIIADREASVGRAVEVMDRCLLAGVEKISIASGKE